MRQFGDVTLPMSQIDLPPPITPTSLLDKSSALALKLDTWQVRKRETKENRNRQLLAIAEGRAPPDSLTDPSILERMQLLRASTSRPLNQLAQARGARRGPSENNDTILAQRGVIGLIGRGAGRSKESEAQNPGGQGRQDGDA